jgi:hypothetical protein
MSSGFTEETIVITNSSDSVVNFLNDLRNLLDKHKAKLYSVDCELFMDGLGYIGQLEDNIETIEITDGDVVLYKSNVSS